jgi:hypothetical protein
MRNEYQVVAKTFKEDERRTYVVETDADVEVGHTFVLDGIVWIVGEVDAENVWCVPWLFDRTNPIEVGERR